MGTHKGLLADCSSLQEQYTFWTEYRLKRSCDMGPYPMSHSPVGLREAHFEVREAQL